MKTFSEKILLALLPFWTPQIPPLGISCLKSFLQQHGFNVKTVDLNIEDEFSKIHTRYFDTLSKYVPESKRGNLFNVGHDVLRNHMMAHLNYRDEKEYMELVNMLVYQNFFCSVDDQLILELNKIVLRFYEQLEIYFLGLLERENPTVLGLSVYDGTLPASLFAAKCAREKYPQMKIVIGGGIFAEQLAPGSPNWKRFLENAACIDKIIIGEGEHLFLKFLRGELPESQVIYTRQDIDGQILDLSSAPIPDFSDLLLERYPVMATYVSRSCPFQCSFCSETVQWGKYRRKKAEQIVRELKELSQRYSSQLFLMCDSLLNPVVTDLANRLLDEGLSFYWDGYLRADKPVCDMENTILWRRGGFYRARLGVESGSQHVLDMMRKKITPQQIEAAVYSLAYAGIKTTTYWVVGYPGETAEDFQQTLDLVEKLREYIYEAWASPFFYYMAGQVNADAWADNNKLVYPEKMLDMLVLQTRVVDGEPSREEAYTRVSRFVQHCQRLGIPNPVSMRDIYKADERWEKLHKNAVPSLVEFKKEGIYITESKTINPLNFAQSKNLEDTEFAL